MARFDIKKEIVKAICQNPRFEALDVEIYIRTHKKREFKELSDELENMVNKGLLHKKLFYTPQNKNIFNFPQQVSRKEYLFTLTKDGRDKFSEIIEAEEGKDKWRLIYSSSKRSLFVFGTDTKIKRINRNSLIYYALQIGCENNSLSIDVKGIWELYVQHLREKYKNSKDTSPSLNREKVMKDFRNFRKRLFSNELVEKILTDEEKNEDYFGLNADYIILPPYLKFEK